MKGTARILNTELPKSMQATYNLIDGKIVRKANVKKVEPKSRSNTDALMLVVAGVVVSVAMAGFFSIFNGEPRYKSEEELCAATIHAGRIDDAIEIGCGDLLLYEKPLNLQ